MNKRTKLILYFALNKVLIDALRDNVKTPVFGICHNTYEYTRYRRNRGQIERFGVYRELSEVMKHWPKSSGSLASPILYDGTPLWKGDQLLLRLELLTFCIKYLEDMP